MELLETNELNKVKMDDLMTELKTDSLFERFAARKANQIGSTKEFMEIKGQKFQTENIATTPVLSENDLIAFRCLHYSVTESAGTIQIVINNKKNSEISLGYRTVDDTAVAGKEFEALDEVCTMSKRDAEKVIEIKIIDNHAWQPDLDFYIEIYDPKSGERMYGDDTLCKITILDEDFPGKLGFETTEITANTAQDKVDIIIKRVEGTDGKISCMIRTEPLIKGKPDDPHNAVEFEDYLPKHEKIEFEAGESEKIVPIQLYKEKFAQMEGKEEPNKTEDKPSIPDEEDEEED